MGWTMIGTWRMSVEGMARGAKMLEDNQSAGDVIEEIIRIVEDYPYYKSVGYGGLPNENGEVELDAAYMDGQTLSIGAVGSVRDFKNPIRIAKKLSEERFNCFLVGIGAEEYAHKNGFERMNMLSDRARQHYEKKKHEMKKHGLSPYDGHDTVGAIVLDASRRMAVGTSTSGLFMKRKGRIGDSPLSGSGFYVDSEAGGATATGLGEDLMKGCVSYEIVRLMQSGYHPQEAADKVVWELNDKLIARYGRVGDLSVVCLNNKGEYGASTNIGGFSFSVTSDTQAPTVYLCKTVNRKTVHMKADEVWLDQYNERIREPIKIDSL